MLLISSVALYQPPLSRERKLEALLDLPVFPGIERIASCVEPFSGFNALFLGNSLMYEHECHQGESNSEDAPSAPNKNLGRTTPQMLAFVVGVLESLRPISPTLESHTFNVGLKSQTLELDSVRIIYYSLNYH